MSACYVKADAASEDISRPDPLCRTVDMVEGVPLENQSGPGSTHHYHRAVLKLHKTYNAVGW